MAAKRRIRVLALAVVRRGDDLLVQHGRDQELGQDFCRPLGGAVDPGELAADAVVRELREELAVDLVDVRRLSVVESIFTLSGRPGHEVVFLFGARIRQQWAYARDELGLILDGDKPVSWQPLARFAAGGLPLYPRGVLEAAAETAAD